MQEATTNDVGVDLGGLVITDLETGDVGVGLLSADSTKGNFYLCDQYTNTAWRPIRYITDEYAGKTVKLEFKIKTDSQLESSFFIDDVLFESREGTTGSGLVSGGSGAGRSGNRDDVIDLKLYKQGSPEYEQFMKEFGDP
ncbi:hypothetical protein QUF63_15215 [Anaerolineales bacterium HSG25]|nr:hypothetical protein [Anaerolineales bacterium HSG25]